MEVILKMSNEWNRMNEADKVKYVKMANEDKLRYEKEKKEYYLKKYREVASYYQDKRPPKKGIPPIFFYQKIRRPRLKLEQPSLENVDLVIKMSNEWNIMSETEKAKYAKMAIEWNKMSDAEKTEYDKLANNCILNYEREKKEYLMKKTSEVAFNSQDKNSPKKEISAFLFYRKSRFPYLKLDQPRLEKAELIIKMSDEWNKISELEKTKYAKMANEWNKMSDVEKAEYKLKYKREKKEYLRKKTYEVFSSQVEKVPKNEISGFIFYKKTRRPNLKLEQPSLEKSELIIKMSNEWKKLSETEKAKYAKMANDYKLRNEREKNEDVMKKPTEVASSSSISPFIEEKKNYLFLEVFLIIICSLIYITVKK